MTKAVYQSMFVSLSMLLLALLFVISPTEDKDLLSFQENIKNKFAQATVEVIGYQSFTEPFAFVWSTVEEFYDESATAAIALLQPDESFTELALMFSSQYQVDKLVAGTQIAMRPPTEDAVLNIVPMSEAESLLDPYFNEDLAYVEEFGGTVAGESITVGEEDRPPVVWTTLTDSITGFPFCVAIFNTEINSYPGACVEEEMPAVIHMN